MRSLIVSVLLLLPLCLQAKEASLVPEASVSLERLLESTRKNLVGYEALGAKFQEFAQARAAVSGEELSSKSRRGDKAHAKRLIKASQAVKEHLERQHLLHLFPSAFISEIDFFSQIDSKS